MLFRCADYQGAGLAACILTDRPRTSNKIGMPLALQLEKAISLIKGSARFFFKLFLIREISSLL